MSVFILTIIAMVCCHTSIKSDLSVSPKNRKCEWSYWRRIQIVVKKYYLKYGMSDYLCEIKNVNEATNNEFWIIAKFYLK